VDTAGFRAAIPADYADSVFPLMYYFELGLAPQPDNPGTAPESHAPAYALYPGFTHTLDNQPYFVVRNK
jgi:hypothetical protein